MMEPLVTEKKEKVESLVMQEGHSRCVGGIATTAIKTTTSLIVRIKLSTITEGQIASRHNSHDDR